MAGIMGDKIIEDVVCSAEVCILYLMCSNGCPVKGFNWGVGGGGRQGGESLRKVWPYGGWIMAWKIDSIRGETKPHHLINYM